MFACLRTRGIIYQINMVLTEGVCYDAHYVSHNRCSIVLVDCLPRGTALAKRHESYTQMLV